MPKVLALLSFSAGPPRILVSRLLDRLSLRPNQLLDSLSSQLQQLIHLFAREWLSLGRALDFDEAAIPGANDVHVHFGARVFVIFQIKQSRSVNDPDADGGNFGEDWRLFDFAFLQQPATSDRESYIRARDGRGARAAVGLQDVAVERNRAVAEHAAIRNRAQAPADQSLDFVRSPGRPAAANLSLSARMRGTRQHAVLCRDPAFRALAA